MKTAGILLLLALAVHGQTTSAGYEAYRRGAALFDRAQFQESLAALEEALKRDPKLVPALTLKAKIAMSLNRNEIALECLETALRAEPSAAYAQFLLGFLHYRQNRMPEALPALEKARRLNPADPRAALYLGLTQETLGESSEALRSYREAIELQDKAGNRNAEPWIVCAKLLKVMGDLAGAERLIQRALEIDSRSRDAHFAWSGLLLKKGRAEDSAKEGEIALTLQGDATDLQVHYLLVQSYRAVGREEAAAKHVEAIHAIERR